MADVLPTPTTEPSTPEPSDEAKIEAAIGALESGLLPADLVAYDLLDARLRGTTGVVDLEVCGWTGDTVFDDVYLISYRSTVEADGTAGATLESATTTRGDCTNTELIETALQFTRDYEVFWRGVANDPQTFDADRAAGYWTDEVLELSRPTVEGWAAEGLSYQNDYFDAGLPGSALTEVLGRSYSFEGVEVLEFVSCRAIPEGFGLYKGSLLVDDFRSESSAGEDALLQYQLVRRDGSWLLIGSDERAWVDCLGFGDEWLDGVNAAIPDPVPWERVLP